MIYGGTQFFWRAFVSKEYSSSAGGLILWPAKLLVPLGFAILLAQGFSEIIKRIAIMRGLIDDPHPAPGGHEQDSRLSGAGDASWIHRAQHGADHVRGAGVFLLLGYPVAFALAANGCSSRVIGIELGPCSAGSINLDFLQALPERIYGVMNNDTLLAIPFFTFMGLILERSGMAEDLLDTIGQLFGPCAAASPMRSSSSARCWPPPPASSRPR
jgi:hypothetical protein